MKKAICIVLGILLILGIWGSIKLYTTYNYNKSDEIPEGYLFVFHGGCCEVTRSTYVYKIDNGKANMGFKYIHTENHTESWGSPNWIIKIVDEGKVDFTDGVFVKAKEHGAYSYIKEPGNDKTFTIEEYQNRFIMN